MVAHEYFHNWTGNRVTCRDWFQLSLKEGLTVFRDQEFGADTYSRPVQRIQEVRALRAAQFPEDAGPMAHPVRPQSYMEISNFYTATVYEKGAEVVRMIHTLIGAPAFRKGMDLYFERIDGQAVTTDDFVQAMQDASGVDLSQFKRWYDQAGTPVLSRSATRYDAASAALHAHTEADLARRRPGAAEAAAAYSACDRLGRTAGRERHAACNSKAKRRSTAGGRTRWCFRSTETSSASRFERRADRNPVPSIARGFSAPVRLRLCVHRAASRAPARFRQRRIQPLGSGPAARARHLLRGIADHQRAGRGSAAGASSMHSRACSPIAARDPAFAAEALSLPSEGYLAEQMDVIDPDAIHAVRVDLRRQLAQALQEDLLAHLCARKRSPDRTAPMQHPPAGARCATSAWVT